jgi:hypothetical protein
MLLKPLSFLRACGASFLILAGLAGSLPAVEAPALRASASTFAVTPKVGSPAVSRTPQIIHEVIGDLKTTLVLFEQGGNRLCFVTSSFGVNERNMNGAVRALVAKELGLTPEQVVAACSHNHTIPMIDIGGRLDRRAAARGQPRERGPPARPRIHGRAGPRGPRAWR